MKDSWINWVLNNSENAKELTLKKERWVNSKNREWVKIGVNAKRLYYIKSLGYFSKEKAFYGENIFKDEQYFINVLKSISKQKGQILNFEDITEILYIITGLSEIDQLRLLDKIYSQQTEQPEIVWILQSYTIVVK